MNTPVATATGDLSSLQLFTQRAAFISSLGVIFFVPISTALMNIFLLLTLIFILLSGKVKDHWLTAWNNPVSRTGILLFLLFALGTTWSIVGMDESLKGLKKYNELWYIALLLPIFQSNLRKKAGINTFLVSMSLILLIAYALFSGLLPESSIPISKELVPIFSIDGGFKSRIITNVLMSYTLFIFAQRTILTTTPLRWLYGSFFLLSTYYALFISTGTTGKILSIILLLLFLVQHFKSSSVVFIPFFISIIMGYSHFNSNTPIHQISNKIMGGVEHDRGSASQRREYTENSLSLISEHPFLGTGTGSFKKRYSEIDPTLIRTKLTENPHNEYMATGVQLGIIGIIGLLSLFTMQVKSSFSLSDIEHRFLAQGLVTLMIVGCIGNSLIMDSGEGHFWAFFSALLFSSTHKPSVR